MSCSFVDVAVAGGSRRINAVLATGSNGSPVELLVLAEIIPSLVWAAGLVFECLHHCKHKVIKEDKRQP